MATPSDTPKKSSPPKKPTATKTTPKQVTTAETVASTEKIVDDAVEKVTKKAAAHVSPELREKATKVAHQAESFATEVEKFGDSVWSLADSLLPSTNGSAWTYHATYTPEVSRLFIFRCLWIILQGPIVFVWSIWYFIVSIVHYISMFLTWTRSKNLREKQARYRRHIIAWKSYMHALTDKRPAILVD